MIRRKRHFLQFRLRSFLLFFVLLSVVLGARPYKRLRQQRAIQLLIAVGARITYADTVPAWLVRIAGEPLAGRVRCVALQGQRMTDTDMALLKNLPDTEEVYYSDWASRTNRVRVSDAGFENLKHLTGLRVLMIQSGTLSDAGLAHLGGLQRLKCLAVVSHNMTDTGLAHLKHLDRLERLSLTSWKVTDAGLAHLKNLCGLKQLSLHSFRVSDSGLRHLRRLTQLEELDLSYSRVTLAGIASRKEFKQLRSLDLSHEGPLASDTVPRRGLLELKSLSKLQWLWMGYSGGYAPAAESLDGLQAAMPKLRIDWVSVDEHWAGRWFGIRRRYAQRARAQFEEGTLAVVQAGRETASTAAHYLGTENVWTCMLENDDRVERRKTVEPPDGLAIVRLAELRDLLDPLVKRDVFVKRLRELFQRNTAPTGNTALSVHTATPPGRYAILGRLPRNDWGGRQFGWRAS